MKRARGRPQTLLARMKGKAPEEIRNAIKYGTPAWRVIRLREMIGNAQLPDNYLSGQLEKFNARMAAHVSERETIYRKHQTHEARSRALRKMRHKPPIALLPLAVLWRESLAEFERAVVRGDADWLNELAKSIRGEVSPHPREQFITKVLDLYERILWTQMPLEVDLRVTSLEKVVKVSATDIFKKLKIERLSGTDRYPIGALKVEGHIFENKNRVMDAIHDIEKQIGFVLARMNKPQHKERPNS